MARRIVRSVTSQITPTSGVAKTILQITAPSGHGIAVPTLTVAFDGTSPTAAKATIDVIKGGTGGTGTSLTLARVKGATGSVTASAKEAFSAEPSGGTVIHSEKWHTQGNWRYPGGEILIDPGDTIAVRVTIPATVPVSAVAEHEE